MRVCNRLQGMFVVGKHHLQPGEAVTLTEEELAELHPMVRANLSAMMEAMDAPPAETLVPGPILPPVPVSEPAKEEAKAGQIPNVGPVEEIVELPGVAIGNSAAMEKIQLFPVEESKAEAKAEEPKVDEEAELAAMIAAEEAEKAAAVDEKVEEPAVAEKPVEQPKAQDTKKSGKK